MTSHHTPAPPSITPLAEGLVSTTFPAALAADGRSAESRTAAHIRAVEHGFYQPWLSDEQIRRLAPTFVADGQQLTGVYLDPQYAARQPWGAAVEQIGFGPEVPVGTFVDFDKTLNAGGPAPVAARLITGVTVNPGFRRRGIFKHMMTDRLGDAVRTGVPIAVLTVSEGSIYGRFGFGQAARGQSVEVNATAASDAFGLRGPATGQVLPADPSTLESVLKTTFDDFHRATRGSVDRPQHYWEVGTARWDPENITSWNRKARAVVHIRDDGGIGGYAVFTHQGWDAETSTVEVQDTVAADVESRVELFRHLASMDLVERIRLSNAPADDPLAHALVNPRARRVTRETDTLWLRVLDVQKALQARQWGSDGEFVLELTDPLGISGGTYRVAVVDGAARVSAVDVEVQGVSPAPRMVTDVETLGSLYLGDVSVATLHQAGRIRADGADLKRLSQLVDLPTAPYCATLF